MIYIGRHTLFTERWGSGRWGGSFSDAFFLSSLGRGRRSVVGGESSYVLPRAPASKSASAVFPSHKYSHPMENSTLLLFRPCPSRRRTLQAHTQRYPYGRTHHLPFGGGEDYSDMYQLCRFRRGAMTKPYSPFRGAIEGSPPRVQRKRLAATQLFSGAPRELPLKHYAYSVVYARGF